MAIDEEAARAISEKGKKVYAETIEPHIDVETELGKFVVIDVESGDYEIDKRAAVAIGKLLERRPGAMTWAERVGFLAAHRWGGRNWVPTNDDRES